MSVLIKGVELPEKCVECKLLHFIDRRFSCCLTDEEMSFDSLMYGYKSEDCPLEEVPAVKAGVYDVEEQYHNCTVQIWKNSVTGETSIGWWVDE